MCESDVRVGGEYRNVFVTDRDIECSFRGTYLEVDPPNKTVATWQFDGWPDAPAIETMELAEQGGITTYAWRLAFRDVTGRSRMTKYDGPEAHMEILDAYLQSLVR